MLVPDAESHQVGFNGVHVAPQPPYYRPGRRAAAASLKGAFTVNSELATSQNSLTSDPVIFPILTHCAGIVSQHV